METKIQEVWKDVVGYEGIYEVSNLGRIWSATKVSNGHKLKPKFRKQSNHGKGYLSIGLSNKKIVTQFLVHRIVAMAWIPNPDNKPFINHKNGIKTDNRVSNLEWATCSENHYHAYTTGLRKSFPNVRRKLTDEQVSEIRRIWPTGLYTRHELAKKYKVKYDVIISLLLGRYKYLPKTAF